MFDILNAFKDIIVTVFEFVSHSIETLVTVFTTIPRFIQYISSLITLVVPNEIIPFLAVGFSFLFMMVMIGRNS